MNTTIRDNLAPASPPPLAMPRAYPVRRFIVHRSSFIIRHSAFTLIELMAVIGIIAIVSTIALPAAKALTKGNSQSQAVNLIRSYINQARSIATSQHRQAGVVFFNETAASLHRENTSLTAMQIFVENYNQSLYSVAAKNTVFIISSPVRTYLPQGIRVAVLNDAANRSVTTGDETGSSSLGITRAILFDANGQMITRHGLARPLFTGPGGTTHKTLYEDWQFVAAGTSSPSIGVSSPGIFLFDAQQYIAANIPTDSSAPSNAIRNAWIKNHADVILLNANTGNIAQ